MKYIISQKRLEELSRDSKWNPMSIKDIHLPHNSFSILVKTHVPNIQNELSVCEKGREIQLSIGDTKIVLSDKSNELNLDIFKNGKLLENKNSPVVQSCFMISGYTFQFIQALNSKDFIQGIETRMKKTPGVKGKKAYRPVTFIHLEKRNSPKVSESQSQIEWDHSFIVRGHWRYFQDETKLGKNRQDEYSELGRTWIKEHKRLEHLEFKEKTRIIRK